MLLSARVLRLNEYFSTDNLSFCVSVTKVGSYTGNPNEEYPHRYALTCSSHSLLLPTDYIWYNIFLILVNFRIFLICSSVFKVTLRGLVILFDSSGCSNFLLVWVSNQGVCFTKTEFDTCTKPMAGWCWEVQKYTHHHCNSGFLARWFQSGRHFELESRFYKLCISSENAL